MISNRKADTDIAKRNAIQEEHIWVPYALRGRVQEIRSRTSGRVLHIGTDDADTALDSTTLDSTAENPAHYDTICSVGALAMCESLARLLEQMYNHLATHGRLLFLEPVEVNPDITMAIWNSGFSLLQVERFSVPGTAPVGSRWWHKGQRTIWHSCVSGTARRKLQEHNE